MLLHLPPFNGAVWLVGLEQGTSELRVCCSPFSHSVPRESEFFSVPAPLLLFSRPSMQRNTRRGVGLLEVALDESKQIWDSILALLLSLCMRPLAVIGPLAASVLPSGKGRYQNLESQQSLLCKSSDLSLRKCWAVSADSGVTAVPVCLGVNSGLGYRTLSAKTRTVLGKLGWMAITLRAVHPHRWALTQLTITRG